MGAVFSVMKAEYVVVAEQAHPLGPAYSFSILIKNVGRSYPWYYCCMPSFPVSLHILRLECIFVISVRKDYIISSSRAKV